MATSKTSRMCYVCPLTTPKKKQEEGLSKAKSGKELGNFGAGGTAFTPTGFIFSPP